MNRPDTRKITRQRNINNLRNISKTTDIQLPSYITVSCKKSGYNVS